MPEPQSRTYAIGLPVIVTVSDDGSVHYEIDTAEAGQALIEAFHDGHFSEEITEIEVFRHAGHIEADHERRRQAGLS